MNDESLIKKLTDRYLYLYENKELILSLAINKTTEVEKYERGIKIINLLLKDLRNYGKICKIVQDKIMKFVISLYIVF